MRTLFHKKLILILGLGCGLLTGFDTSAATLREILDKNGRDYVLANSSVVATQLDEREKYFLARMLMRNLRGGDAPEILIPLAQKGDISSIQLLAMHFGTGKEGIKSNKSRASLRDSKLESLVSSEDEKKRKAALAALCGVYKDPNHLLFNKELAVKRCEEYYKIPDASLGMQADSYMNPKSPLYAPVRAAPVYEKCFSIGDILCKINFAWAGTEYSEIAKRMTKRQLFEYASLAVDVDSSIGLNNLGVFYLDGFGTPKNPEKAVELFDKAAGRGVVYALYNLLQVTFFKYAEWKDAPKTADRAMVLISYYDYFSPEADRFDSVPFKEWIFSKGRLPLNDSEFRDFLSERAKAGSDTSACMLSGHLRKVGDLGESIQYAEMGRQTSNIKVQQWCANEIARIDVLSVIKP
jgi:TPR repeat protein